MTTCSCGKSYDPAEWLDLPWIGMMPDGDGGHLELRDCTCGSTISVEIEEGLTLLGFLAAGIAGVVIVGGLVAWATA